MLALRGCDVLPFEEDHVGPVGGLLAKSGTSDIADAFLVLKAAEAGAAIVTSDADDIGLLLDSLGVRLPVLKP